MTENLTAAIKIQSRELSEEFDELSRDFVNWKLGLNAVPNKLKL